GGTSAFPEGNVTSVRIGGLLGNVSYGVQVVAFNAEDQSTPSNLAVAAATLYPLVALPPQDVVVGSYVNATQVGITANVTGGLPPFEMTFSFGDGTSTTIFTTSGDASVLHPYSNNYSGVARVVISTMDAAGDATVAPTLFFPVQATPLGVPAILSVGDGFAHFAWTAPPSPAPIVTYTTFWTTNASLAPYLAEAWPSNASVPQIHLVTVGAIVTQWNLPLPVGTEVFGQVVAVDKYGVGLLPPEAALGAEPYLDAVVADFAGGPLTGALVGSAPFADSFSAAFTTGVGNQLENATYHFSDGSILYAAISGSGGTYYANASHTFSTPGPATVYLYATDQLSELILLTLDVVVTPGPDPVVSVSVAPTPVFVNTTVGFTANVSGGSGHYAENWSFGDGGTGTGLAVTNSYVNATTYLVQVVVTDTLWGGVTTVTVPVDVLPLPTVEIAATASGSFGTYRLTAVVIGGYGNFSYTWLFDDGTQGTGASVVHGWATGSYDVTLEVKDVYGHSASATVAIVVGYSSTTTGGGSTGYAPIVVYGLIAALLVVAFLAVLFAARSRRPPEPPAEDDATGLAPLEPHVYEEEPTRSLR
ncbi:MAG: PKD domain-containing protein, partial [Thermoplasmata archaeon]